MGTNRDETIAITRRAAIGARLPFAGYANTDAIVNASGNIHFAAHRLGRVTLTAAIATWIFDNASRSVASGTSCLNAKDARLLNDLTSAATVRTRLRRRTRLGATS